MGHAHSKPPPLSLETSDVARVDRLLANIISGSATPWPVTMCDPAVIDVALQRLEFHGVSAMLVGRMAGAPKPILNAVREAARLQALWEATHRPSVGEILGQFSAIGIGSLILKGTALAYTVWDRPEWRRRGDTDLFILPDTVEQARSILKSSGWQVSENEIFQETWTRTCGGAFDHAIDLHWRMRDMLDEPQSLGFASCFARSIPLDRFHSGARTCDVATTFINCSLNHAAHRVYGYRSLTYANRGMVHLGGLVDTDLLAKSMTPTDWSQLVSLTNESGTAGAVLAAATLASDWLSTPIPVRVVEALSEQAARENDARSAWSKPMARNTIFSSMAKLRAARGWRAKRSIMRKQLWPPAQAVEYDHRRGRLGLFSARILRLGRIIAHMGRGDFHS